MAGALLPEGFRFGVATSGFQVEGGYNGPGQPANNWHDWERAGRVERSGIALDFWNRYENHLDRALDAGCDAFRLSLEWARCEPVEGEIDDGAFDRYAAILDACHQRGIRPVVALHHFTHPRWLGPDFWLQLDSPERFSAWATEVAGRLASRCQHWITINEVNAYGVQTYLAGAFPPGRLASNANFVRCLDHMLAAHVLAYRSIRTASPAAVISTNNHASSLYEVDRLLLDLQLAPAHGVAWADLHPWLADRRARWYASLPSPGLMERGLRRATASVVPLDQALPRSATTIYAGRGEETRSLDVIQVNYYNPWASDRIRVPGHRTAGGRSWRPFRELWDDPIHPAGLAPWCRANSEPGLALEVAENGMCNRVVSGRPLPRSDGWDRIRYLHANLSAVVEAIDGGLPVSGYFHWTLADNYEWGSYQPRFGLFGVDRRHGLEWSDRDSLGGDAAGTYRRLADGLRSGDRSVLSRAEYPPT